MRKWVVYMLAAFTVGFFVWLHLPGWVMHPDAHEITGFKYVRQPDDITCGPTSTLMVLTRYGKPLKLDEVKAQTKTKWFSYGGSDFGMTSPDYVSRAFAHFGVPAHMKHGSLDELKRYVSQNRPVVVLLRSGPLTWHYVAVTGYTKAIIITADPASGRREEIPTKWFQGAWDFTGDMDGNEVVKKCEACGGTGYFWGIALGPLTYCDICGGSGRQPDYVSFVLRLADVLPNTMIVPSAPLAEETASSKGVP